jgi:hypothetical protein
MTDRELLEAAAKAAGMSYVHDLGVLSHDCFNEFVCWNPLTDDGDALRLAVKLRFEIDMDHRSIAIRHQTGVKILRAFNNDPCATTRRAIVRAAAELWKQT